MPLRIDKYTIISDLGEGGQAIVYLATDPNEVFFAVKVFKKRNSISDSHMIDTLLNEFNVLKDLKHANIVRCIDFSTGAFLETRDGC